MLDVIGRSTLQGSIERERERERQTDRQTDREKEKREGYESRVAGNTLWWRSADEGLLSRVPNSPAMVLSPPGNSV